MLHNPNCWESIPPSSVRKSEPLWKELFLRFSESTEKNMIFVFRLQDDQKNVKERFNQIYVPNINQRMVRLADVANPVEISGPASINRQDRGRYIQVSAGLNPDGKGGLNKVIQDIDKIFASGENQVASRCEI
jgi:multidrug efflux pump subunit AcrB